jgi:hypothetical protein
VDFTIADVHPIMFVAWKKQHVRVDGSAERKGEIAQAQEWLLYQTAFLQGSAQDGDDPLHLSNLYINDFLILFVDRHFAYCSCADDERIEHFQSIGGAMSAIGAPLRRCCELMRERKEHRSFNTSSSDSKKYDLIRVEPIPN